MRAIAKSLLVAGVLSLCFGFPGCQSETSRGKKIARDTVPAVNKPIDPSISGEFAGNSIYRFDSTEIGLFIRKFPLFKPLESDLQKFYRMRKYTYAWYDREGLIDQAENLYNHIINIGAQGIQDKTPYRDLLTSEFDVYSEAMETRSPRRELMLTCQYFSYANAVWGGLGETELKSMRWFLPRKKMDLPSLMDSLLLDSSGIFIQKGYATNQYFLLRRFLNIYRQLDSAGSWETIRADRKSYRLHDSTPVIRSIRQRLYRLGDLGEDNGSETFDNDLEAALKKFQSRWGLREDGILAAGTLRKLNTTPNACIRKILVNMERDRWIPVSLQDNYVVVNIPAFELYVVEKDSIRMRMKVVVGKVMHETVVFNGNLQYVVFSPYWNVPPAIMKKEIMPALKKNPGYLKKNDMEWNGNTIRQKPGPENALGLVKFLFPNTFNIYLHDSPAKHLFSEETRAFSHGCIRVAEPGKLAIYLLRNQPEWTTDKIDAAMKSGKEKYVTLKNPLPVYIAYLTAWVDRAGNLNLRDDIYKRDNRLEKIILAGD